MEVDLAATAKRHSVRRSYHRPGTEFNSLGHALKLPDSQVDFVPLFFLYGQHQQHQVCADRKICRIASDDEGFKLIAHATGLEGFCDHLHDVAAKRVHLGLEIDAAYAVSQIDQRCAGVLLHYAVELLSDLDRPDAFGNLY